MHTPRKQHTLSFLISLLSLFVTLFPGLAMAQMNRSVGELKILIISADWEDKRLTKTHVELQTLWTENIALASEYWEFHSYQKITGLVPTFTPRYTIPTPLPTSDTPKDPTVLQDELKQLAIDDGFNLSEYDHVITSMPSFEATSSFGALGAPDFGVLFPGNQPAWTGTIHELGHAFGVAHAGHFEGGNTVFAGFNTHVEGRDGLYMMGSEGGARAAEGIPIQHGAGNAFSRAGINVIHSHSMGHLPEEYIIRSRGDAIIRLFAMGTGELREGRDLAAVVNVASGTASGEWWLSYSPQMAEHWSQFNADGWLDGINVHTKIGTSFPETGNLDFTPASQGGTGNEKDYIDSRDGALRVGTSWTFPGSEVTLRPVEAGMVDGLRYIDVEVITGNLPTAGICRSIGESVSQDGYFETNESFTLKGSSGGTGGLADSFHYCSRKSDTSNAYIQAKIENLPTNTSPDAKSGLMLRSTLDADSAYALLYAQPDGQIGLQVRSRKGEMATSLVPSSNLGASVQWLRLIKRRATLIASYSEDGSIWTDLHTLQIDLGSHPEIGLALTSSNPAQQTEASFSILEIYFNPQRELVYKYDLGPRASPLAPGYERLTVSDFRWVSGNFTIIPLDRGGTDPLTQDFIFSPQPAVFEQALPNGSWEVAITFGDNCCAHDENTAIVEGDESISRITTTPEQLFITNSVTVDVTDGALTIEFMDEGGDNPDWVIPSIEIKSVVENPFPAPTTPFENWIQRFFPASADEASLSLLADTNGDGISNGLAFYTGTNPNVDDPRSRPIIQNSNSSETMFFILRRSDQALDFSMINELSSDLSTWMNPMTEPMEGVTVIEEDNGYGTDEFGIGIDKITIELDLKTQPKLFLRQQIQE